MPRIYFHCRKCEHQVYLGFTHDAQFKNVIEGLQRVSELPCPACGEEAYDNWILDEVKEAEEE